MKILVSGSSGLIGSALCRFLKEKGHDVFRMVRDFSQIGNNDLLWNPEKGELDRGQLEGFDAMVHLAGANLAAGRWNKAMKKAIRDSRVLSTRLLCDAISNLRNPPKVFASASAIGIYGDRGAEILSETSSPGQGFLAEVGKEWEDAASLAAKSQVRVINLRFGIVLSPDGGALAKMLTPFKLGLGGVIGSGKQFWSWIGLDDAVSVVNFGLICDQIAGPLNVVSPLAVTNREFTRALGAALRRPTYFGVPSFAARSIFGEMADETLLASTRVVPATLSALEFKFEKPELQGALESLLQR